ncbi:MAG: CDP-diacylglycerol--glycerol-3-phosphate 3-phosphatidyltransferase [Planctomycetota bacterium]
MKTSPTDPDLRSSVPLSGPTPAVPVGSLRDVPNQITVARLVATLACFVCLSLDALIAGFWLFVLAAATDWADGYWARRWGPITRLGRVLDPLADKLLICGLFVFLAAMPGSDVAPWVAVLVLARELVVTGLRAFVEGGGGDFSAVMIGKLKMVAQCVAGGLCLLQAASAAGVAVAWLPISWNADALTIVDAAVAVTVVLTVWSGGAYTLAAWRFTTRSAG